MTSLPGYRSAHHGESFHFSTFMYAITNTTLVTPLAFIRVIVCRTIAA
jgi:hypothetical protein